MEVSSIHLLPCFFIPNAKYWETLGPASPRSTGLYMALPDIPRLLIWTKKGRQSFWCSPLHWKQKSLWLPAWLEEPSTTLEKTLLNYLGSYNGSESISDSIDLKFTTKPPNQFYLSSAKFLERLSRGNSQNLWNRKHILVWEGEDKERKDGIQDPCQLGQPRVQR